MQNLKNFKAEVEKGREGRNIGISSGLEKLDSLIYGIQRKTLYLIGSDSGAGEQ